MADRNFLTDFGHVLSLTAAGFQDPASIARMRQEAELKNQELNLRREQFNRQIQKDMDQAETRDLSQQIMRKQLDLMGNGQIPSANINGLETPLSNGGSTKFPESDYIMEQKVVNVRGVPTIQNVPKLKPALPSPESKAYKGLINTEMIMSKNLDMLEKNKSLEKYMSPSEIKAWKGGNPLGALGNVLIKMNPKDADWGVFKAETDKAFQTFRKETTGAQAALAELGWLAPDYPETDDNPTLYKKKAVEAISRIQQAKEMLKGLWSPNYRMTGLETNYKNKTEDITGGFETFTVNGKKYNIPKNEVADFKKDMGL